QICGLEQVVGAGGVATKPRVGAAIRGRAGAVACRQAGGVSGGHMVDAALCGRRGGCAAALVRTDMGDGGIARGHPGVGYWFDSDDDGGLATSALIKTPSALDVGPDGSLYILDASNYVIRRVR